jgi:hypothetical protein
MFLLAVGVPSPSDGPILGLLDEIIDIAYGRKPKFLRSDETEWTIAVAETENYRRTFAVAAVETFKAAGYTLKAAYAETGKIIGKPAKIIERWRERLSADWCPVRDSLVAWALCHAAFDEWDFEPSGPTVRALSLDGHPSVDDMMAAALQRAALDHRNTALADWVARNVSVNRRLSVDALIALHRDVLGGRNVALIRRAARILAAEAVHPAN